MESETSEMLRKSRRQPPNSNGTMVAGWVDVPGWGNVRSQVNQFRPPHALRDGLLRLLAPLESFELI